MGSRAQEPRGATRAAAGLPRVLVLFGTRPEVIKLAPVVCALEEHGFPTLNVSSGQHADLVHPLAAALGLRVDRDLRVSSQDQTPSRVCQRVLAELDPLLESERPGFLLVQGDTTTTLAGALAGFYRQVPVGHVEAGLRSGRRDSPFPEEMNRRLVTSLASLHFAATPRNVSDLRAEGVPSERIVLTGNPIVDSVRRALEVGEPSELGRSLLGSIKSPKLLVLTTHRRESFGAAMAGRLRVLRRFVEAHPDVELVFPIHPNPGVRECARSELAGSERIHLVGPLDYFDFVHLLARAWLVVSDSGGVQEEAPTLGKAVIVIRENTERPEAIEAGVARLAVSEPELASLLEETYADPSWIEGVGASENPFGQGDGGRRIAQALDRFERSGPP
jgi:UDP-N-acetylglucosamine 2-epimerase (non-hydrolysing)